MIRLLLLCLAFLIPVGAARAAWGEATSANFIVYGEGSQERLVRFATELEQYDQLLRTVTNARFERNPTRVRVYLVHSGADVQRLMNLKGSGVLGVYNTAKEGPFFLAATSKSGGSSGISGPHVLRHEYVHHFMLQNAPAFYPPWYREGFAEYYATAKFDEPTVATIGAPIENRLATLAYGDWGKYEDLLSDDGSIKRIHGGHIYAQGWLLVHAMSSDKALSAQVHRYLLAINNGRTPAEAYKEVFGDKAGLDARLGRYFGGRSLPAARVTLRKPINPGSIAFRKLSPSESEMIPWTLRLRFARAAKARADLARDFRKVSARLGADPAVLRTRAAIEHAAGSVAEALAAADGLLKLAPEDADGLLRKGLILTDEAERSKAPPARWAEARALIVKANAKRPDDAFTLYSYHQTFLRAGQTPPPDATAALVRSYELVPQDSDVRLAAAVELERVGRLKEARIVAEPLAYAALPREEKENKDKDESDKEEEREYRTKVQRARELLARLEKQGITNATLTAAQ